MLIPTEAIATAPAISPRRQYLARQQVLRRQQVPTGFPLAIPERRTTCIPRKGGYPQTRGGLSLLPRICYRHQHLPPGCQLWSPECSTRFSQSLYDLAGLFRTPSRTLLHYNGSFSSRPNPRSERLVCPAPAHPRTISFYGSSVHNNVTE